MEAERMANMSQKEEMPYSRAESSQLNDIFPELNAFQNDWTRDISPELGES